ncbi:RNA polymerase sigma factor SigJ [Paenibacillus wynnii]|uniref:RNA polymerase sigma24 factor n=1 Tax=Paenibacillus wynnii TaxID=268407 RepID=A0A098MDN5_9BACL|nr:RNA polymerase sigma factor SigJ [Paenibacillus wynnii]KGE20168.1 RNA polymerase sigma24 factor [Paenibacillus wynnii]
MQELYEQYRALLFTLAYQLTGSASDAEDVLQDVFLKLYDVQQERLIEPKAYLCKMVTNRSLDLLKSARKQREQYYGEWLPEPICTEGDDSLEMVVRGQLLSYAMLVLLERLSPAERSVFVLREALGFEYLEIAGLVGKSEANCRKLFSRARGKMGITLEEPIQAEAAGEVWVSRFLSALERGDVNSVVSMLAEDVVLISDGGGKAFAAVHPVESRDRVLRFLLGLVRKAPQNDGMVMEMREINGQTGLVFRSGEIIQTVALMLVEGNLIRNLYFVRNSDKLGRI